MPDGGKRRTQLDESLARIATGTTSLDDSLRAVGSPYAPPDPFAGKYRMSPERAAQVASASSVAGSGKRSLTSILKTSVIETLKAIDMPRSALVSTAKEFADLGKSIGHKIKYGSFDGGFSGSDWLDQTNGHMSFTEVIDDVAPWLGQIDLMPGSGTFKPLDNIFGLIGDVALDPLTYLTFGESAMAKMSVAELFDVAAQAGKLELANEVRVAGKVGLRQSSIDQFSKLLGEEMVGGLRFKVPGTGNVSKRAARLFGKEIETKTVPFLSQNVLRQTPMGGVLRLGTKIRRGVLLKYLSGDRIPLKEMILNGTAGEKVAATYALLVDDVSQGVVRRWAHDILGEYDRFAQQAADAGVDGETIMRALGSDVPPAGVTPELWQSARSLGDSLQQTANEAARQGTSAVNDFITYRVDWQPAAKSEEVIQWLAENPNGFETGGAALTIAPWEERALWVEGNTFLDTTLVAASEHPQAWTPREQAFDALTRAVAEQGGEDVIQMFEQDFFKAFPAHVNSVAKRVRAVRNENALFDKGVVIEGFRDAEAKVVQFGPDAYIVSERVGDRRVQRLVAGYEKQAARVLAKQATVDEARAAVDAANAALDDTVAVLGGQAEVQARLAAALDGVDAQAAVAGDAVLAAEDASRHLVGGLSGDIVGMDAAVTAATTAADANGRRIARNARWVRSLRSRIQPLLDEAGAIRARTSTTVAEATANAKRLEVLTAETAGLRRELADAEALTARASRSIDEINADIDVIDAGVKGAARTRAQLDEFLALQDSEDIQFLMSGDASYTVTPDKPRMTRAEVKKLVEGGGVAPPPPNANTAQAAMIAVENRRQLQLRQMAEQLGLGSNPNLPETIQSARIARKIAAEGFGPAQRAQLSALREELALAQAIADTNPQTIKDAMSVIDRQVADLAASDPQAARAALEQMHLLDVSTRGYLGVNDSAVWWHTAVTEADGVSPFAVGGDVTSQAVSGGEGYLGPALTSSETAAKRASEGDGVIGLTVKSDNPRVYGISPDTFPEAVRDPSHYGWEIGSSRGVGVAAMRDDMLVRGLEAGVVTPAEVVQALGDTVASHGVQPRALLNRYEKVLAEGGTHGQALDVLLSADDLELATTVRRAVAVDEALFARNKMIDGLLGDAVESGVRLPEARVKELADHFRDSLRGEGFDSIVFSVRGDGSTWGLYGLDRASLAPVRAVTLNAEAAAGGTVGEALAAAKASNRVIARDSAEAVQKYSEHVNMLVERINESAVLKEAEAAKISTMLDHMNGTQAEMRVQQRTNRQQIWRLGRKREEAVARLDRAAVASFDEQLRLRGVADDLFEESRLLDEELAGGVNAVGLDASQVEFKQGLSKVARLEAQAAKAEASLLKAQGKLLEPNVLLDTLKNVDNFDPVSLMRDGYRAIGDGSRQIPQGIFDGLNDVDQMMFRNGGKALSGFDAATQWFKAWAILSPGFHERNYLGGVINNSLAGVQLDSYVRFRRLYRVYVKVEAEGGSVAGMEALRGSQLASKHPDWVEAFQQVVDSGVMTGGQSTELTRVLSGEAKATFNPLRTRNRATVINSAGARWVENNLRGTLAFDRAIGGHSMETIVGDVYKYHFNYDDLSGFERGVARRVIPFYTWTRKNFPLQLEMLATNPKIYNRLYSLKRNVEFGVDEQSLAPSWYFDSFNIHTSLKMGGNDVYLMPDLPINQLTRTLDPRELVSSANPWLKVPVERFISKRFFTDSPFYDTARVVPLSVQVPLAPIIPALEAAGVARRNPQGVLQMSDRNYYTLTAVAPPLAQLARLVPDNKDDKQQYRRITNWVNFAFGAGLRVNTPYQQDLERRRRQIDEGRRKRIEQSFSRRIP